MKLRFDLDPTLSKVAIIGILMFLESLLVPIYAKLQTGSYPTPLEFFTYLIAAVLILITYLLAFVKTGSTETSPT
jgi:hypothetical protein